MCISNISRIGSFQTKLLDHKSKVSTYIFKKNLSTNRQIHRSENESWGGGGGSDLDTILFTQNVSRDNTHKRARNEQKNSQRI